MSAGLVFILLGLAVPTQLPIFLVTGISLIAFAEGLSMAVLYRFALMSSEHGKGVVASGTAILAMICYALGIEITRVAYVEWGQVGFSVALVGLAICFMLIARPRILDEMRLRAAGLLTN
jgi:DHA1 family multidrug/chloramphenicol efflux transport protein-like MFS transporter